MTGARVQADGESGEVDGPGEEFVDRRATSATTIAGRQPAHSTPVTQFPPIPFGRLVRVEWSKTVGTRAARWLIGVSVVATAAVMAIPLSLPDDVDQTRTSYLTFAAVANVTLLPLVALLSLTTEWTQRTVLVTFTLEPRRGRVLAAKVAVGLLLGLAEAVYALAVTFAAMGIAESLGRDVTNPDGLAPLVGFVPFILLNILMAMAFGAVLHNTAAAITLQFALPAVWGVVSLGVLDTVGQWLDSGQAFNWILHGTVDEHVWQFVTSISLWVLLPLAAGLLRTARREVS